MSAEADYYNTFYGSGRVALSPLADTPLKELYLEVCRWLPSEPNILDLGSGTGLLAEALLVQGHRGSYRGLDFSPVAVEHAQRRLVELWAAREDTKQAAWDYAFAEADLREWAPPEQIQNLVFVCLETLEHLDDDLALVERIPAGRRLILSVPTFNSKAHVRHFPTVGSVWRRYEGLLRFRRWTRVGREDERGVVHLLDTIRRADSWGGDGVRLCVRDQETGSGRCASPEVCEREGCQL